MPDKLCIQIRRRRTRRLIMVYTPDHRAVLETHHQAAKWTCPNLKTVMTRNQGVYAGLTSPLPPEGVSG